MDDCMTLERTLWYTPSGSVAVDIAQSDCVEMTTQ